ncbi:MAG: hypothetical protein GY940_35950, partial [bacterium]|nr:hypothetical protein [bacterium]
LLEEVIKGKIEGVDKYDPSKVMIFSAIISEDNYNKIKAIGVDTILIKRPQDTDELKKFVDKLVGK